MTPSARLFLFINLICLGFSVSARPTGGGGGGLSSLNGSASIGIYGGIVNASQDSMNQLQSRANTRAGGISTPQMNQAYELAAAFTYRYSGTMYAVQIRPSYFYQRVDGHAPSGSYTYGVTGYTLFPLLRIYPLENDFVKFYMQAGLGYGQVNGMINEGMTGGSDNHVNFSSSAYGSVVGMGAEFVYSSSHAFSVEVDYRYLTFNRNIGSGAKGTFASGSLSQAGNGQEVELDGSDLEVRMGGLMFLFGYSYYF